MDPILLLFRLINLSPRSEQEAGRLIILFTNFTSEGADADPARWRSLSSNKFGAHLQGEVATLTGRVKFPLEKETSRARYCFLAPNKKPHIRIQFH